MAVKHARAIAHLTEADPVPGRWIAEAGPCGWSRENAGTHFDHISRSIVYQQLSGAAASTIYGRVLALYGGATPTPAQIARTSDAKLRAVGLSTRKVEYIKDLARHTHAGTIPVNAIHEMEDAEVIATLTQAKAYTDPIVTEVKRYERFYSAGDYHQDYFARNPNQGYCRAVVAPKVEKFEHAFEPLLKRDAPK